MKIRVKPTNQLLKSLATKAGYTYGKVNYWNALRLITTTDILSELKDLHRIKTERLAAMVVQSAIQTEEYEEYY